MKSWFVLLAILLVAGMCVGMAGATPSPQWLSGWNYVKAHQIASQSTNLTFYQISFDIYNTTGSDTGNSIYLGGKLSDPIGFSDIRITSDNVTSAKIQIVETYSDHVSVSVAVPSVVTTGSPIFIYYNNTYGTIPYTTVWNPKTFLLFTNFDGTEIDGATWKSSGITTFAGGKANVTGNLSTSASLYTDKSPFYGVNTSVRFKLLSHPSGTTNNDYFGYYNTTGPSFSAHIARSTTDASRTYSGTSTLVAYATSYKDAYHTYEVARNGSKVDFYIDNILERVHTTDVVDYPSKITFTLNASPLDFVVVDSVLVRNITFPVPSHGSYGSETPPITFKSGVLIGDSISSGHPLDTGSRFYNGTAPQWVPDHSNLPGTLSYELPSNNPSIQNWVWLNNGWRGQYTAEVLARWQRDALAQTVSVGDGNPDKTLEQPPNATVCSVGTNDVAHNYDLNGVKNRIYSMALLSQSGSSGITVFMTIPPIRNSTYPFANNNVTALNSWMLTNLTNVSPSVKVYDAYALLANTSGEMISQFDSGDGIHPNGAAAVAESYNISLLISQLNAQFTPPGHISLTYPAGQLFTDASTGSPTAWDWQFNEVANGTWLSFNASQNPFKVFHSGNYSIRLNASTTTEYDISDQVTWVNVTELGAGFTSVGNLTSTTVPPMYVSFDDQTSDTPTMWNWSFGDGTWFNTTDPAAKNPSHFYSVAGTYDVTLIVKNADDTGSITTITRYVYPTSDVDGNVTSWLHFNGPSGSTTITGEVGPAWLAAAGANLSTTVVKYGSASLNLFSNDARVSTPSATPLDIGRGNATIEAWVWPASQTANKPLIKRSTGGDGIANGWGIYNTNGAPTGWAFWWGNSAANSTATFTLPTETWSHVAVIWNNTATNRGVSIFVNGILQTTALTGSGTYDTVNALQIGANGGGVENKVYIDEFRLNVGNSRWLKYTGNGGSFNTPYNEYQGNLYSGDTNLDSTMRFKTDPAASQAAIVANQTNGGWRYLTIQVQNVSNSRYVSGSVSYDPDDEYADTAHIALNTTYYPAGLTLVSSSVDLAAGQIYFNVSKDGAGFNGGTDRVPFLEVGLLYDKYANPETEEPEVQTFGSGYIINATDSKIYPIHHFVVTNMTYLDWQFQTSVWANNLSGPVAIPITLTAPWTGAFPNEWNWSVDGVYLGNTTTNSTIYLPSSPGTKSVTVIASMIENASVSSTYTNATLLNITPYAADSFTQQDITMDAQYTVTINILDSVTGLPIPISTVTDSNGNTVTTTNGTATFTEPYSVVVFSITSTGYVGKSVSVVVDNNIAETVQLTPTSDLNNYAVTYPPKDIRFHIQTWAGNRISGTYVTAMPFTTTIGNYEYVGTLFGYDFEKVPLANQSLSGYSDSNGDISFAMMADYQYQMSFTKSGYTFSNITMTPHDDNYVIRPDASGSLFVENGTSPAASVTYGIKSTRINTSVAVINISYTDVAGATFSGQVSLRRGNGS